MPPRRPWSRMLRPSLGAASPDETKRERTHRQKTEQILLDLVSIDSVTRLRAGEGDVDRGLDQAYLAELAYQEDLAPLAYQTLSRANSGITQGLPVQRFQYVYGLTCRRNVLAVLLRRE